MNSSNSHDPFARRFLSKKQESIDYFRKTLPAKVQEQMDLENLELMKENFIGKTHEESRTDLLYKIPLKMGSWSKLYRFLFKSENSYRTKEIYPQFQNRALYSKTKRQSVPNR